MPANIKMLWKGLRMQNSTDSSDVPLRTCTRCGASYPETPVYFYRHPKSRAGLTAACKVCINADNKSRHEQKIKTRPEHIRALANARMKRHYHANLEKSRARHREAAARARADPEKRAVIYARKRGGGAGLSPEEIDALFAAQGYRCAVCGADGPGSRAGWNLDHCHKSQKVRFILCAHCNRGLGAFRDSPDLLRHAANILEGWINKHQQNQPARPVAAIMEKG